jgi:hypothetical protein
MMPGCRDALSFYEGADVYRQFVKAECIATLRTMFYFGPKLGFCQPTGANVGQTIRVVVAYIDQQPARMHEDFESLALEALQQAWPCRK